MFHFNTASGVVKPIQPIVALGLGCSGAERSDGSNSFSTPLRLRLRRSACGVARAAQHARASWSGSPRLFERSERSRAQIPASKITQRTQRSNSNETSNVAGPSPQPSPQRGEGAKTIDAASRSRPSRTHRPRARPGGPRATRAASPRVHHSPVRAVRAGRGPTLQRGRSLVPIRNPSTACAAWRPSRHAGGQPACPSLARSGGPRGSRPDASTRQVAGSHQEPVHGVRRLAALAPRGRPARVSITRPFGRSARVAARRFNEAGRWFPSRKHRPRVRPGDPRGSPTPPGFARGACRRRQTRA